MRTGALARRLTAAFVLAALPFWPQPITAQPDPAPFYRDAFVTTDGTRLSLEALRGKVVLLDFWATWCAPCLAELPRLRQLHEELGPSGLVIVGVSLDAIEPRRFASWTRRNGVTWPQVRDGRSYNGALARAFNVEELPATALFDRDGRLAARDIRGEPLEAAIRRLLAGVSRD
ncbi:MAG: TlpA family protein disulfide reductase [Acidobacteria bacterium]|nr:TlpA family protein disulfide reductase [Acidobacteriota bacterium]